MENVSTDSGSPECPVCGASVTLSANVELGELLDCDECSSELEVTGVNPTELAQAPEEEEDWGE